MGQMHLVSQFGVVRSGPTQRRRFMEAWVWQFTKPGITTLSGSSKTSLASTFLRSAGGISAAILPFSIARPLVLQNFSVALKRNDPAGKKEFFGLHILLLLEIRGFSVETAEWRPTLPSLVPFALPNHRPPAARAKKISSRPKYFESRSAVSGVIARSPAIILTQARLRNVNVFCDSVNGKVLEAQETWS